MKIKLDYIARVEGEAAVDIEITEGRLIALKLNIWEPPRFFEGFMKGRSYAEAPDIVARICGICPVSHMTTAIAAIEQAMSVTPTEQVIRLRRIMTLSQIVASHLIHIYMLALPDYHRLDSIAQMLPDFKAEIARLLRMKEVINGITSLFGGGRALHPVAMVVGGFTDLPPKDSIGKLIKKLESIKGDAIETLKMASLLPYPEFTGGSEFVALADAEDYAINSGRIVSSKGINSPQDDYSILFEEVETAYSNAKRTTLKGRGALMVGALARVNLKFDKLHPDAKKAALDIGFVPPSLNPFNNILAQAIEIVHGIGELTELLDGLQAEGDEPVAPSVEIKVREGAGSAITEAPRGLLFHHYEVNRRGIIERANIVTPTAHNFFSLEEDLRKLVTEHIDKPQDEISRLAEMLVRAYDPCFSCSVH